MNVDLNLLAFYQNDLTVISRIWYYLTYPFTFGRITVSAASLAVGLIVLALTFALARAGASLFERRLQRQRIDPGLRYTISRLVRYVVITVGILLSLKQTFAIDLTSIAVVFTALSVGIGFGLQYIAADIASGFILLFERPIRIGDRITIGDDEGDVHSINLRTTTVVTNNGIAIIVPNSKLVSQRVVNWSYGDPRARIPILVSVADESDIDAVTSALLDAARDVENVLEVPEPKVQFLGFGISSLDFRLLVWTSQPRRHIQIRSDINYRISNLFHSRGLRTATAKQELFVRGVELEQLERDLVSEGARRESAPWRSERETPTKP
ncbi:MAG TPA: mechanosensitive ion channel domain-containing protein [Pyrinomonadaceae bacterium]|nr:mechanosensitive ion channel domain-containing protein [Pyrinomonadaceae bacterium]